MLVVEILGVVIVILVIAGLLAPLESLGWWTREGHEDAQTLQALNREAFRRASTQPNGSGTNPPAGDVGHYLVFLSGIGISSSDTLPYKEVAVVDALEARIGGTRMIKDIYPYSPQGRGLTAERPFAWVWRRLVVLKQTDKPAKIAFLINFRNAFQCFVSYDQRYGPVYNLGVAEQIWQALRSRGYDPEHPRPVTILGWSGGAQVAVGAAWYLAALGIPVYVLSMGGIFGNDPGIERVSHLWHLYGSKDRAHVLGALASPGRWGILRDSAWNRAIQEGRVTKINIGPMTHSGEYNYFAPGPPMPDGRAPWEHTVDAIMDVLVNSGLARDQQPTVH